jgi:hypothetical protein
MNEINREGIIYYGFDISLLDEIDKNGINYHQEKNILISVSQSGYEGVLPFTLHEEIEFLSKEIYSKEYNAVSLEEEYIKWNSGYKNSLTYIDGFGATDLAEYNSFGVKKETRVGRRITAVIDNNKSNQLLTKEEVLKYKECEEEYLSLALHPYAKAIAPESIIGWITDNGNIETVKDKMSANDISSRKVWLASEI